MSVFQVQLNNEIQGKLDINPNTGVPFTTSVQREVYVTGPKKINRLLKDGDTFTDCNYWKKFAYPQTSKDKAFITVLSDDGSVYSDVESENTYGVGRSLTLATSYNDDNTIDFMTTYGGPASFLQVQNQAASSILITGELNGDTNLIFTLAQGETQVFNTGDLAITKLRLKAASGTPTALVLAAVKTVMNS